MNTNRSFNKAILNCFSLALLVVINALLQAFRLYALAVCSILLHGKIYYYLSSILLDLYFSHLLDGKTCYKVVSISIKL
jgi:hypothetical protein